MKCPHCGYDADPGQEECPLCGTPLEEAVEGGEAGVDAGGRDSASAETAAGARELTPWEAGGGVGALVDTWWESLSNPEGFFSRVDWDGGWESPLLYYLLFMVVGAGLGSLWSALLMPAFVSALGVENLVPTMSGSVLLRQFFLSPFRALFSLAVFAGAAHLVLVLLADRPRRFLASGRALCYAAGPQLLMVVPFLGGLAAVIWSAVLAVVGLRTAHRTSTGRVLGALFLAFFVYVAFSTVWGLVVQGALAGSLPFPTMR
ncbi:MAG: YIP1 family protein [Candidatus Palauibacterales bacterium]|nr:YIP1 family protein [Candidatus Palauibacterales bacterium]